MQYTTRVGDRPALAHVNYQCPCGCVAGLTYDRHAGAEHLGRCCCGRLLWVGAEAETRVRDAQETGRQYDIELNHVTLPWGEQAIAALAVPVASRQGTHETALVRDVVCNMRIDPTTAAGSSVYEGATYYFCAAICQQRFDANPLQFLAREA